MSTFNVRVQYESGVTVSHNGLSYFTGKPAPDLAVEPLTENLTGFGWVPFWTSTSTFSVGQHAARASLAGVVVIYKAQTNDNLKAEPVPRNTTGLGWVPIQQERQVNAAGVSLQASDYFVTHDGILARVWDAAASYTRGDVVLHQGVAYGAITAIAGGAPPSVLGALTTGNWLPLWRPDAHYAEGQLVAVKSLAAGLRGFRIHNDGPVGFGGDLSWVPVWSPHVEYAAGAFTRGAVDGTVYFLVSATHAVEPKSNARNLSSWVPVWTPTDTYLKGVYVYHRNTLYVCSGDDLSTGDPLIGEESGLTGVEPAMNIPNDWIAVWKPDAAYESGQYVSHNGERFVALAAVASNNQPSPANTSAASWIRVWAPQTTYQAGCAVSHDLRIYLAVTDITVNVKPCVSNTWGHGWVPVWLRDVDYPAGVHVYNRGAVFGTRVPQLAANHPDEPDPSNPICRSSDAWVPAWQPGTAFARGSVAFYDGDVYLAVAAPAPAEHPYIGSNVWAPVWRETRRYPITCVVVRETDGAAVISISSPLYVLRSLPDGGAAPPPASGNMSGDGWVLVWQADDTIEYRDGEWVYWAGDFFKWQPGGVATGTSPDTLIGQTAVAQEVLLTSSLGGWVTSGAAYTDGAYTGSKTTTVFDAPPRRGEWLQLSVRSPAKVTRYVLQASQSRERAPRDFDLLGSMNGTVWHPIDTREGVVWQQQGTLTYTPAPEDPTSYNHFRLVVREVGNLDPKGVDRAELDALVLFGTYSYTTVPFSALHTAAIDVRSEDQAPSDKKRWFQNGDQLDFTDPTFGKQCMLAPIWADQMTACGSVGVDDAGCVYALYQYTDGTLPVVRNGDGSEAGNITLPFTEATGTTATGTCALVKYGADGAAEWAVTVNNVAAMRCSATGRTGHTLFVAAYTACASIGGVDLHPEDNTLFACVDSYGALVDFWTARCAGACAAAAYHADGATAYVCVQDCGPILRRRNGLDVYTAAAGGTQVLKLVHANGVYMVQWSATLVDAAGVAPTPIGYGAMALNAQTGTVCIGGARGQQVQVHEPGRLSPWFSKKVTETSTASVMVLHQDTGTVLDEVLISQNNGGIVLDAHKDAVTSVSCDARGNMAATCVVCCADLSKVVIGETGARASKLLMPRLTSAVSWHITVSYNASLRAVWAVHMECAAITNAYCTHAQDGALYLSGSGCTGQVGGTHVPADAVSSSLQPTKSYVVRVTSDGISDTSFLSSASPDSVLGSVRLFEDRRGRLYGVGVTRTGSDTITGKTFDAAFVSPASLAGRGAGSFLMRMNINNPYRVVPTDDQAMGAVLHNNSQGLIGVLLQDSSDAVTRASCILEPGQTLTLPSQAAPPQPGGAPI